MVVVEDDDVSVEHCLVVDSGLREMGMLPKSAFTVTVSVSMLARFFLEGEYF